MAKKHKSLLTDAEPTPNKGEQTRALILNTALEMFSERGYEETTMRAIAEKAGVALGNTYYYFRSKEHLIQAFYDRLQDQNQATCRLILQKEKTLQGRLRAVLRQILENAAPYHQFSGILFRTAADPGSPLNPFSPESENVRQESIAWFAEILAETKTQIPPDLAAELPFLLWLYHMGIILFWIHDKSPNQIKTTRLMEHTVDIVAKLITLASNPLLRPLRQSTLRLLASLRTDITAETAS